MSTRIRNLFTQPNFWRNVGIVSSAVGILSYAWSLSFEHQGEKYHFLKISLYGVVSFTVICIMLSPREVRFSKSFVFKPLVGVFALMLTSLYSFFSDKDHSHRTTISVFNTLISSASFSLVLLSLLKQNELGFEPEFLNFYLGCLTLQLMNINFWIGLVGGAAYCYLLNVLLSYSNSQQEIGTENHEEHVAIEIDTAKREETEVLDTDFIGQLYSFLGNEINKNDETETVIMYPENLEAKFIEAMASGFVKKEHCHHVFCAWRRQFLEGKLFQDLMSTKDVQKIPLKYLKDEIERWKKASNDAFRVLFFNERHLSNRVFGFSSFADRSFTEICNDHTIYLLNFASAMASTSGSPERLFKIILVFEALDDLMPDLESLFSGEEFGVVLLNEAKRVCKRLREAIKGVFMELENLIRQDQGKVVVFGGGLHPTNRYVMNYIFVACQRWKTLELAFDDEGSPSSSSLGVQVAQILEVLESNLKAYSKVYKNSCSLCYIFLMNNWRYIVHKVTKCEELGKVLGEDWIQSHVTKMGQYLVNYQRSSWDQVLGMLSIENEEHEKTVEMLKLKFEEICEMQGTWIVIDDQIREVIKKWLKKTLLPAFENFMARFQNAVVPFWRLWGPRYCGYHRQAVPGKR